MVRNLATYLVALSLALGSLGGERPAAAANREGAFRNWPELLPEPAVYRAPSGVEIRSWDPGWTEPEQLAAVYDQLIANTNGAELAALAAVELYPGVGLSAWRGQFEQDQEGRYYLLPGSRIRLYTGGITTAAALAPILAHEYGHHFTAYWFTQATGRHPRDFRGTEWERVRGLVDEPRVMVGGGHQWDPVEIMAEDYRQLLGAAADYPQENQEIPPAAEVPGLAAYWLDLAGLGPADSTEPVAAAGVPAPVELAEPAPWHLRLAVFRAPE